MNKHILFAIIVSLLLTPSALGGAIKVVATTTVLEDMVEQVGGDLVEVDSIVSSGVCPGHWDLKPSQVNSIAQADVIVQHGMESWVANQVSEDQMLVKLPGVWNTPQMAIEKVQKINEILKEIDPENGDIYDQRTQWVVGEMEELAANLTQRAEDVNANEIEVLCMEWQNDFVSWMGFNVTLTYGSEETLSIKDVNELINVGKEKDVTLVISNLQSGVDFGDQMAEEVGAAHVILTNFPGAVENTDALYDMILYNGNQLINAV